MKQENSQDKLTLKQFLSKKRFSINEDVFNTRINKEYYDWLIRSKGNVWVRDNLVKVRNNEWRFKK